MVSAFVVHELFGRLRLRIPEKRKDGAYFAELAERLSECPGVTRVESNALTGSVLLLHTEETTATDVARYAEQTALFSNGYRNAHPHAGQEAASSSTLLRRSPPRVEERTAVGLFLCC